MLTASSKARLLLSIPVALLSEALYPDLLAVDPVHRVLVTHVDRVVDLHGVLPVVLVDSLLEVASRLEDGEPAVEPLVGGSEVEEQDGVGIVLRYLLNRLQGR